MPVDDAGDRLADQVHFGDLPDFGLQTVERRIADQAAPQPADIGPTDDHDVARIGDLVIQEFAGDAPPKASSRS